MITQKDGGGSNEAAKQLPLPDFCEYVFIPAHLLWHAHLSIQNSSSE